MKNFKQLTVLLLISLGITHIHAANKYHQQVASPNNYKKPDLRQQRQAARFLSSLQAPQRNHHVQLRNENRQARAINFVRQYKKLDVLQQIAKADDFVKANKVVVREHKKEQRASKQFGLNDTRAKALITLILLPMCLASETFDVTQKITFNSNNDTCPSISETAASETCPLMSATTALVMQRVIATGGATMTPMRFKDNEPKQGIVVAPCGRTQTISKAKFLGPDGEEFIKQYIKNNAEVLSGNLTAESEAYLGVWDNDHGTVYLDVSAVFPKAEEPTAMILCAAQNQEAAYDLSEPKRDDLRCGGNGDCSNITSTESSRTCPNLKLTHRDDLNICKI